MALHYAFWNILLQTFSELCYKVHEDAGEREAYNYFCILWSGVQEKLAVCRI